MSRFGEVPCYAQRSERVDAVLYNLWRRACLRQLLPLHFEPPEISGIILIIEYDHWLCANAWQNDLPILAWHSFPSKRDNLHKPVPCTLDYYHFAASRYRRASLDAIQRFLSIQLHTSPFHE